MTHKLVPIDPTQEMVESGIEVWKNSPLAIVTIYQAMLSAAPSGWMPIESAPRELDSTKWLLVGKFDLFGTWRTCKVRWLQDKFNQLGWVGYDDEGEFTVMEPTHWMPLPPAPEVV